MLVETAQLVSISQFRKELARTFRSLSDSGKPVYILKDSNMEAVLVSYQEYAYLKDLEEVFERYEIKDMVDARMEKYNPKDTVSWEDVKKGV